MDTRRKLAARITTPKWLEKAEQVVAAVTNLARREAKVACPFCAPTGG
jgi:hypothetical protein